MDNPQQWGSRSSTIRVIVVDALAAFFSAGLVLLLLRHLHGEWQPWRAVLGGLLAGVVLRRLLRRQLASFPAFLRRPLTVGVVVAGSMVAALASLGMYSPPYWVSKARPALELIAAAVLLDAGLAIVTYTHSRLRREVEEARSLAEAERALALRAQLSALQAQINPHFLFNALNVVAEMAHQDPHVAERLIGDLSHLLRYSLRSSSTDLVPLEHEIEAVLRYLDIERARFGERLRSRFSVDDASRTWGVPGLLLQPLVENSVLHAVSPSEKGGEIVVEARVEGDRLHLVVEDDGPGLPPVVLERLARLAASPAMAAPAAEEPAGTGGAGGGLANVARRLALAYRGVASFEATARKGGGTRFEIVIPRP